MLRPFKFLFIILFVAMMLPASCTQDQICLSNQSAVQVELVSFHTNRDTTLAGTTIFGLDRSSERIYDSISVSRLFLPLSFSSDTTAFVISSDNYLDTIWFRHQSEMEYISRECGFTFNFELDTIWFTNTFIDSVSIIYPLVNYGEDFQNVQIYIY
ncbi:DUF6452 family protein [Alkalitalea saponilacus]|uniref:Lipoprotein n=1 Tax=Alkalitalea saponilacus TaxID=889453 RepID=A0A1T5HTF6_9BACT|nr:DUF6452 family protein [Alkalitalea saponilacus]ASB49196.1 hypothetical protein CDL62_08610 [Alkalitalea saponilacus]SKC23978.1 hypothetical protein SAMN03080601_03266 [Alkalitalea saponilacus]